MRYILLLFMAALLGLAATGCISDDFTDSPSDTLTFSTDTLSFDTVFTGQGTPTARLLVFNPAKKSVNISSIRFARATTEFSMNVDGVSGSSFSDVEVRGGDSIYVFVECRIDESQHAEPQLVSDRIQFVTNGVLQEVQLEAWGQNVRRLRGLTVTGRMTLDDSMPYVITDSLVVAPGATLEAGPGTRMLFHDKARMVVRGCFEALGEPGRLVHMRGDRLDNVLPDVGYEILAGQWQGVTIESCSFGNRMEYVEMQSTVSGLTVDSCGVTDRRKLLLVNSWLHNSQGNVLTSAHSWVDAYGVCFSEAAGAVVSLTGGRHELGQCTLSNYYLFAVPSEPLLCLYHLFPKDARDNPSPLMRARVTNSILYGMAADINEGDLAESDVFLERVLLKSNGDNDEHFIDCLWGEDPLFYTVRTDYIFDYRLQPESPALHAGYPALVPADSPCDLNGVPRLGDGDPALGAYSD